MSQETLGYVRTEWTCTRCGTKNPGNRKTCASCGNAMSAQDQFELPAQQELITDQGELSRARRGAADLHCPYCGARNPADAKACTQCGGDLTTAHTREAGRALGAFHAGPAPEVKCPTCGASNPASAVKCKQCGSPLSTASTPARPPTPPARSSGIGIVGLVALAVLAVFFILLTRTSDTSARVASMNWERSVQVMELRPAEYADWKDQIPSDGRLSQCTERVRRTQDEPAPNADQVCGTPYAIDQGDGTAKIVQDCQYNVKDQWCTYTRNEWQAVNAVVAKGDDLRPHWPEMALAAGQREGERSETYVVVFETEGKQYPYSVSTVEEFARFAPGSRWTLKVNGLGAVVDAQPAQ
ncbi:MAG TPA: zinc ribbon domain-containing protein [Anaerolineae bacterium]